MTVLLIVGLLVAIVFMVHMVEPPVKWVCLKNAQGEELTPLAELQMKIRISQRDLRKKLAVAFNHRAALYHAEREHTRERVLYWNHSLDPMGSGHETRFLVPYDESISDLLCVSDEELWRLNGPGPYIQPNT